MKHRIPLQALAVVLAIVAGGLAASASGQTPLQTAPSTSRPPIQGVAPAPTGTVTTVDSATLASSWQERVVGTWSFEHSRSDKEGLVESQRGEITFGKDGRYGGTTLIRSPAGEIKLNATGRYALQPIDATRVRMALQHESRDPEVAKEELNEVVEVTAKDSKQLLFPNNVMLVRVR
jgi:hypothetical protein